ncbi:MAG: PP2C family protein-serine/threonine phosphatase [Pararhodobacter sp.]
MTAQSYRFETGSVSHVGRVREHNEDRLLAAPDIGLWLVADGMGGHFGGDVAAEAIVEQAATVSRTATAPDLMARFVDRMARANDAIREHSARNQDAMIGATIAGLLVHGNGFAAVWCGDSRVYLMRDGALVQLTRDHTEVQELLDAGAITEDQARSWPRRNVITRAVGVGDEVALESVDGQLQDRDCFVLCSDGLTGHLEDPEIAAMIRGLPAQRASDALVAETLARGAQDNVTVVVVRCALKTVVGGPNGEPGAAE